MSYVSEVTIAIPKTLVTIFEELEGLNLGGGPVWDHKVENQSDTHTYYEINDCVFDPSTGDTGAIVEFCEHQNRLAKLINTGNTPLIEAAIMRVGEGNDDIEDYFRNGFACGLETVTEIMYV